MLLLSVAPLVITAAVGAAVSGLLFVSWYFSEYQSTLRAIRAAKRVDVRDARDGEIVRIVGTLQTRPKTSVAPLSGRECAHYDLQVDVRVRQKNRSRWRPLFREVGTVDFEVDDGTGRALVSTELFKCAVVLDHHQSSGTFNDATPELEALLARHGHTSTDFLGFNKGIRYREGVLEAGEQVAVVGRARWEDDPEAGAAAPSDRGGYRTSARKQRLVVEAHAHPVHASDDPAALG